MYVYWVDWLLGLLTPSQWELVRNWGATIGGLIALIVATRTYFKNARTRREEQPRMVYSTIRELKEYEPGSVFSSLTLGATSGRVGPGFEHLAGDLRPSDHALRVTVAVVNKSKEAIGPIEVNLYERTTGTVYDLEIGTVSIDPESESRFTFCYLNPVGTGLTPTSPMVTFRDSGGRWWRRRAAEPIKRSRDWIKHRRYAAT